MTKKTITFRGREFLYKNSFEPNLTSNLIAEAVLEYDLHDKSILDLGCGCGALGLSLIQNSPSDLVLADISSGAIKDSQENIKNMQQECHSINVEAVMSDGFSALDKTRQYDVIVNDVSGISEEVAQLSSWFDNAPCDSGIDGLHFFKQIILEAKDYLVKDGLLLTPLLSLSNVSEARAFLNRTLISWDVVKRKEWFLPEDMAIKHKKVLDELINSGNILMDYKFGRFVVWTEVLVIREGAYR